MIKRIGWKVVEHGRMFAVYAEFEGGIAGNALILQDTKEDAQGVIDSGMADELERLQKLPPAKPTPA
jgi:hypothetical protein